MTTRRADAVQNRIQLLRAAESVFLEFGVTAPLDLIVDRAKVSRATLFRNFADRQALTMALLEFALQEVQEAADAVADRDDGLLVVLRFIADHVAFRAPLHEYWHTSNPHLPEIQAALDRLVSIFAAPVTRAVKAGLCREDLMSTDFVPLVTMMGTLVFGRTAEERRLLADRSWRLMLDALKYSGSEEV
ncbi:MAG: TetR/AcrR family transcriptional regulator [Alphaproteobacteria bacterium]|nr:MAG: TetR/AcrR family transcriptional regulator [Alphaproteobacteria bacterium]